LQVSQLESQSVHELSPAKVPFGQASKQVP
jgi:hypothetical protein